MTPRASRNDYDLFPNLRRPTPEQERAAGLIPVSSEVVKVGDAELFCAPDLSDLNETSDVHPSQLHVAEPISNPTSPIEQVMPVTISAGHVALVGAGSVSS